MTTFATGARVRILAPSCPNATGVVTDPANGNAVLTVTVLVDGRENAPARETYFDPTDELELINGTEKPTGDDRAERIDCG